MKEREIAVVLLKMTQGMNYTEQNYGKEEIDCLEAEISTLKAKSSPLYSVIETIVEENMDAVLLVHGTDDF